jgi:hypothetical protein
VVFSEDGTLRNTASDSSASPSPSNSSAVPPTTSSPPSPSPTTTPSLARSNSASGAAPNANNKVSSAPESKEDKDKDKQDKEDKDKEDKESIKQKIKTELEKCPTYYLLKLKEEIEHRRRIEEQWREAKDNIDNYTSELKEWKRTVMKQLEQERAKNFDQLMAIRQSALTEIQTLKAALKEKDEIIASKDQQLKELNEEITRLKSEQTKVQQQAPLAAVPPSNLRRMRIDYIDADKKLDCFVEALFERRNGILLSCILEALSGRNQDELLKSLLFLFDAKGEAMRLFQFVIDREVATTSNTTILSVASTKGSV